jgi:lipoprotein-anchoring transpeptidase ErfK/SrfK
VKVGVLVVSSAVVLRLGASVGGAYLYERSRGDVIADGVSVAGVDVGGLDASVAEVRVRRSLAGLRRPVVVQSVQSSFELHPNAFGVRPDVEAMVGEALSESRHGSFLGRAWRDLAGGSLDEAVPLRVRWSRPAVERIVRGVSASVDRAPRNARLIVSPTALEVVPGEAGIRVRTGVLRRELVRRLVRPGTPRFLRVPTEPVQPWMTEQRLVRRNAFYITIDRGEKRLRLWRDLRLAKTYAISVGQIGLETPAGFYRVRTKAANPAWYVPRRSWAGRLGGTVIPGGAPNNPIKARWLGIYDGAGIHGTSDVSSLGAAASHGCIRMSVPDVIELYNQVPVGTRVYIR